MRNSDRPFFQTGIPFLLVFVGIAIGSLIEATANSFSIAVCAGSIIALAGSTDRQMRNSVLAASFGALFIFIIGASIIAIRCRTDTITHLRSGLLQSDPMIVVGAGLIYVYLVMRMAVIPLVADSNDVRGWVIGIGPGWISAAILGIHISGTFPQHIIEELALFINGTTLISLLSIGISLLRNRSMSRWIHLTTSGIGILVVCIIWSGPFHYQDILELIIRTSALSLGIILITPIVHIVFAGGSLLLALGLAGFPLGILYDLRRMLYLTVESAGVNIGFMIIWLVPLVALFRGLQWRGRRTESRITRYGVGPLALYLGIVALFITFPDLYSVWISR